MINHIDIFAHILPSNFLKAMLQIVPNALGGSNSWMQHPLLTDLKKHAASLPFDEQQVLSAVNLNPENFLDPEDDRIVSLNRSGNEEMAQIVKENQNQFLAAVVVVPIEPYL